MTDIKKDLKELHYLNEIETFEDKKSHKKLWIFLGAVFMIFLMVSFIFVQYPLMGIIMGQIQSAKIIGNTLETSKLRIIFTGETLDLVMNSWNDHPNVESTLCFQGYRVGSDLVIESGYEPVIYEQTFDHVSYEACDSETILMFHTHPWKHCIASDVDIDSLHRRNLNNPDVAMIIMCENKRFSVYD